MNKRVFMVHGWDGSPDEGWRPWLKVKLEKIGFAVSIPTMPDASDPKQEAWVNHLSEVVGSPDEQSYFIGHSLGCIAILRYLESLPEEIRVGGVILVAGFDDDLGVSELSDFFKTPIDWEKIRAHADSFVSIESDNDPYGLEKYNEVFSKKLHAKTLLEHDMKHFSGDDGITELPVVLRELLQIAS
jgi:uncharacterized protein